MADGYTKNRGLIDLGWWDRNVEAGKREREHRAHEEKWQEWRRWYRGEWGRGMLPSNIYFKIVRTFIPRVYYRNPSVSITPSKPGMDNMLWCKVIERADNKLLQRMRLKQSMKTAVLHGFMFGTGGIKLGFGAEFTPTPDDLGTAAPEHGGFHRRKKVEYNSLIHPNMPWALPAHPGNVVVPVGAPTIEAARWVCYESVRTVDDVKADKRFKNTSDLGEGVGDSKMLSARLHLSDRRKGGGVLLREIRDKKTGIVFVYAPYAMAQRGDPRSKVLYEGEDELQKTGRLGYYPLIFNPDDESFWGVPLSQIISPIQVEKNEARTMMMRHRRVSIVKILAELGAISPDEESKIIDGTARGLVKVKDISKVRDFPPSQMPAGLVEQDEFMDREAQELMGLGVNQFGEYAPGSADRSATEANIVNQATQIRIDEHRDACADLLVDLVSDMNELIIDQWAADIVVDVVGPAGLPIWIKFNTADMLHTHDYDMNVDPDSSIPQTKQMREQKAVQMFQLLSPNPLIDPQALTEFLLNELYGVYADSLMRNPAMNTSPQNPMSVQQAVGAMQQMPQPNGAAMAAARGRGLVQ